jgi:hypothetical protein
MIKRLSIFVGLGFVLMACTMADLEGTPVNAKGVAGNTKGASEQTCTGGSTSTPTTLPPQNPNDFPKCACASGGKARCIPKGVLPDSLSSQLEACSDGGPGACVPDSLVKTGGQAPKTCKSAFGEGRCMDLCVPEVAKNATLLNRGEGDACETDERCVPCLNPLKNNEPTGVCEIGKPAAVCNDNKGGSSGSPGGGAPLACPYTGPPIVDTSTFAACGDGMRCAPAAAVKPEQAAILKKCPDGNSVCAPEKAIAAGGNYVPKTCASVGGAEGRCTNINIPDVAAQKAMLPKDTCDANELCAPCFSPIDGKETGACRTASCDAPTQPAKQFAGCCVDKGVARGKCVPKSLVPPDQAKKLKDDDPNCAPTGEVCAPNENLDPTFKPQTCTANSFLIGNYSGVCVSKCVEFGFAGLALSSGNCPSGNKCAPCTDPLSGKPSGAPGCTN